MIFDGKKLVPRKFVLTTLAATRRCGRPSARVSAPRRWVPIVLRWKKRPSITNAAPDVNHFATLTNVSSFSQFNFYLDQFLINRGIASKRSNAGRAVVDRKRRVNNHTPAHLIRAKQQPKGGTYENTSRRIEASIVHLEKTVKEELAEKRERVSNEMRKTTRTYFTRRTELFHGAIARRRSFTAATTAASNPGPFRVMTGRVFAAPSRNTNVIMRPPIAEARAKRTGGVLNTLAAGFENLLERRDELVWRRIKNITSIEEERSQSRRVVDQREEAITSKSAPKTERAFSSQASRAAASAAVMKFDPALVDRLTNEIIRKVEKRARIERERRGIL